MPYRNHRYGVKVLNPHDSGSDTLETYGVEHTTITATSFMADAEGKGAENVLSAYNNMSSTCSEVISSATSAKLQRLKSDMPQTSAQISQWGMGIWFQTTTPMPTHITGTVKQIAACLLSTHMALQQLLICKRWKEPSTTVRPTL